MNQFYGGVRRFECKKHALERFQRYRRQARPDADKTALARVWHALWADSKMVFGQHKASLTQADVRRLFLEKGVKPDLGWRVVPKDPNDQWGITNAAIVPKDVRRALVAVYTNKGNTKGQQWHEILASCEQ